MGGAIFFPRGRKWGVLCFFRAGENTVNLHKTSVLFVFRVEVLFFPRGQKRGVLFFSRAGAETPFYGFRKTPFQTPPFPR